MAGKEGVLILNRRDIRNPAGGGAEIYTHEIAKGLVSAGYHVDIFSSLFKGAETEETIDGVRYMRKGNELTVHYWGFRYARSKREDYSAIIDEFNGLGFGGFLLPKSLLLIHQLYKEFWFKELGPLGLPPYLIEPILLRLYRSRPAITVSESTRADLEALGFSNVRIVMNALNVRKKPLEAVPQKEKVPTIAYLGRLRSTKRPGDAIRIFKLAKAALPNARLWIMGKGPEEARLRKMAERISGIEFLGYIADEKKFDLLSRAHLLLVPSVREGFGINVIEAASQGTPSIGYDIHGLRDSIKNGQTGYLVRGPEDAAGRIIALFRDEALYREMAANCTEYARQFNWDRRRGEFVVALREMLLKK